MILESSQDLDSTSFMAHSLNASGGGLPGPSALALIFLSNEDFIVVMIDHHNTVACLTYPLNPPFRTSEHHSSRLFGTVYASTKFAFGTYNHRHRLLSTSTQPPPHLQRGTAVLSLRGRG